MGEAQFAQSQTSQACQEAIEQCEQVVDEAMRVRTPGGAIEVQWSLGFSPCCSMRNKIASIGSGGLRG